MESRRARHWRAFVHELLYPEGAVCVYDGACFMDRGGAVAYAEGCFLPADDDKAMAQDLAQFPALFEQLTRRAVLAARVQQTGKPTDEDKEEALPLPPSLRVGEHTYQVVSATLSSVSGVTRGRARGLVAQKLPFGVLLVAFRQPLTLERVLPRLDRACNALRR